MRGGVPIQVHAQRIGENRGIQAVQWRHYDHVSRLQGHAVQEMVRADQSRLRHDGEAPCHLAHRRRQQSRIGDEPEAQCVFAGEVPHHHRKERHDGVQATGQQSGRNIHSLIIFDRPAVDFTHQKRSDNVISRHGPPLRDQRPQEGCEAIHHGLIEIGPLIRKQMSGIARQDTHAVGLDSRQPREQRER